MLNRQHTEMLGVKDKIFEIFAYSNKRRKEIGAENVFDFSLGNPSVPAPPEVAETIRRLVDTTDPIALHSYSPAGGIPAVRETIAADLNRRYGCHYSARNLFMTCGAAAALSHALRAVSNPGEEIVCIAPCFSEYRPYILGAGCVMKTVAADEARFQIDLDALAAQLSEKTAAVLINSPCNPSGVVYSTGTITALAALLREKSSALGRPIYLISDEPYRDIVFAGVDSPYISNYYADTLSCYSYSKSISLPGERIGYVAINPACGEAERIFELMVQISRTTGHNGAPALLQRVAAACCSLTSDLGVYERNKELLYRALCDYGYDCVEPGGTFYMFPRAPGGDAAAFCARAMREDLMLVPGGGFGCPGHFRIAYCVPTEKVERALPVFQRLIG